MMHAMVVVVVIVVMIVMLVRQMHVELHAFDAGLVLARNVQVIAVELELPEFALQPARVHAQINQRADEHVAADAAEDVEVKRFHWSMRNIVTLNIEH